MSMRIQTCLDNQVWPWITRGKGDSKYYINSSILELFGQKMPDLTLKKLAERTGLNYVNTKSGKKKIRCTKTQLDNLLGLEEEEEEEEA